VIDVVEGQRVGAERRNDHMRIVGRGGVGGGGQVCDVGVEGVFGRGAEGDTLDDGVGAALQRDNQAIDLRIFE
jgi:hypothetical protein